MKCPECGNENIEEVGTIQAYKMYYSNGQVDHDTLWETFEVKEYRCLECEAIWK